GSAGRRRRRGCARRPLPLRCDGRRQRRALLERELDDEARALAGRGLDADASAPCLDEAPSDREAETRGLVAAARGSSAVERLEDPLALVRRDPGALVDDAHAQAVADRPRTDRDGLALAVAGGVLEHVHERTLELRRVALQRRQLALDRQ